MSLAMVSIVFTDLVDSTAMAGRLGPTEAERVRQGHFRALRSGLTAHGGTEVKNLGDGLMVVFASPSEAVAGAVAMQQAIDRYNRTEAPPEPLAVRIGLSTGEVDASEGDYFGTPVVEAARLCAAAGSGQILATEVVGLLAGRRGADLRPIGDLELKGLPDPVAVLECGWEPVAVEPASDLRVPLPPRLSPRSGDGPLTSFVGRTIEREVLAQAIKEAAAGSRQVVLLAGEAGMGKTTLLSQVAGDAHGSGAVVLYGRCEEDLAAPYQPWVECLGHLVAALPDEVVEAHVSARGPDLSALVPTLGTRLDLPAPRSSDPETDRFLLYAAVADLLERTTSIAEVVVVLDDLHWADRPSLQLLKHLLTTASVPLALIGAYRDTDVGAEHPLADLSAALHRHDGVRRISLRGLADTELLELMERAAGHGLGERALALRDAVLAETDGNPFFSTEILRHLVVTGVIGQGADGRWNTVDDTVAVELPVSVREVVGRRVHGLGQTASRVLAAASGIGRDFAFDLLAAIVEVTEDELIDVLDGAVAASVLDEVAGEPGRFTFAHALFQRSLYDDLGATRRRLLHQRIAEALDHPDLPIVATPGERARHHLAALARSGTERAIEAALAAGDHARERVAADEAARWYEEALHIIAPGDDTRRIEVLLRLGQAQREAGSGAYRATFVEAAHLAHAHGDVDSLVAATLANTRGFTTVIGETDRDQVEVIHLALASTAEAGDATRARLLARLAEESHADPDLDTRDLNRQALELAERSDDDVALTAAVLATLNFWLSETLPERLALIDRYWDRLMAVAPPFQKFWLLHLRGVVEVEATRPLQTAAVHFEAGHRIAKDLGDPVATWLDVVNHAWLAGLRGHLDHAQELADQALELGLAADQADAMTVWGGQSVSLATSRGDLGSLVESLEATVERSPGILAFRPALALALVELGRTEEAIAVVADLRALGLETVLDMPTRGSFYFMLIRLCPTVGDQDLARQLIHIVEPIADRFIANSTGSWSGVCRGALVPLHTMLGDHDEAEACGRKAIEIARVMGTPFALACYLVELGRATLWRPDVPDPAAAREMAAEAASMASAHGLGGIERQASDLLSACDESLRRGVGPTG